MEFNFGAQQAVVAQFQQEGAECEQLFFIFPFFAEGKEGWFGLRGGEHKWTTLGQFLIRPPSWASKFGK